MPRKHRKKPERKQKVLVANPVEVQLDPRTKVFLKDIKALPFWRERYPNLTILKNPKKKAT